MSSSLAPEAKILLLTSEGGSITLRTESEGGGMVRKFFLHLLPSTI